eukprot:g12121.t1
MLLELLILQQLAIQAFSDESFVKADGSLAICWTHCKSMVVANWGRRAPNHRTIRCATFHWTPGSINVQKRHHHIHRGHEEPSELERRRELLAREAPSMSSLLAEIEAATQSEARAEVANVTSTPKPTPTRQDSKLLGMSTYVAELGHATFRVLKDVECLSLRWHSFVTSICGDMTQNKSAGEDLEAFGPPSEVSCHQ